MNVMISDLLILGNNKLNKPVEEYFTAKGYSPVVVEDVNKIKRVSGEIGDFHIELDDGEIDASFVVLTEKSCNCPESIDGGKVKCIYNDKKVQNLSKKDRLSPVVFLLDYFCESPQAATIRALKDAKQLAQMKRRVYYFNKFVRTGGHQVETLYKEARNAGVTFVKYEDIAITYNDDTMEFAINAKDGVMDIQVVTGSIYAAGVRGVKDKFRDISKKLRLKADENGYIVEDKYYLTPVVTSRKGVYHITLDIGEERLQDGLDYIDACISGCDLPGEEVLNTAIVDGEKCVLCYTCYRACPHGAMEPDREARVMRNMVMACEGCGVCASVCPGNAITLDMEDLALHTTSKTAKTLVLCCENSAEVALRKVLPTLGDIGAMVDVKPVPCGGRIGLEQISEALSIYGKVMVAVCMDDACRHFDGNKRACRQAERMVQMLENAGLPSDRIQFTQVSHAMPKVLGDALAGFIKGGNS